MEFKNPFKSFSYVSIANLIAIPTTAIATILLARYLEPIELGLFLTGEAFVEMFSFFFTMGFKNSILKIASEDNRGFKEGLGKALGNALLIRALIAIPVCVVILLLGIHFNQETILVKVIIAFIFIELFKSFTNIFGIIRKALDQFKLVAGINILDKLLKLAIIVVVFKFIGGLEEYLWALVVVWLVKFLISFLTTIRLCKPSLDLAGVIPMIKESFLYGVFDYMENAQSRIDRLMINYILGPSAVAFYAIPSKLNKMIKALPVSLRQVFLPQIHQAHDKPEEISKVLKKLIKLLALSGIPVSLAIYFFAEPLLGLFFDARYQKAIELAPLFAFIAIIWFLNSVPIMLLAAKADHKGRNFIQLIAVIINLALNFMLIPKYGIEGAIWATISANFLKFLALSLRYKLRYA